MWKAAKAAYQFPVVPGKAQVILQPCCGEQGHGTILIVDIFTMHEGHKEESQVGAIQRPVPAIGESLGGDLSCLFLG